MAENLLSDSDVWGSSAQSAPPGLLSDDDVWGAPKPKEQRGAVAEIGRQIVGGLVTRAPAMIGGALEWWAPQGSDLEDAGRVAKEYWTEKEKAWEPDLEGRGFVSSTLIKGASQLGPSLAGMGAAMINPVLGGAAVATIFGGQQAQDTYDKGLKAGLSETEASEAAYKTGLIEGFGETVADVAGAKLLTGGGKLLSGLIGKGGMSGAIRAATDPRMAAQFARDWAANAVIQSGTEFGQGYGQAVVERDAGISTGDPLEQGAEGAQSALGMSVLLGPLAAIGGRSAAKQRAMIGDALNDPSAPLPVRMAAGEYVAKDIEPTVGKEAAQSWLQSFHEAAVQDRDAQQQPAAAAPDVATQPKPTGLLGYQPGPPLVVFPDASTMTGAEAEQRRLDSMVQRATPSDILAAPDVATAIAAAVDSVAGATDAALALPAAELIDESPVTPQLPVQTPESATPIEAQPEPAAAAPITAAQTAPAAVGQLDETAAAAAPNVDAYLKQNAAGKWQLSRPVELAVKDAVIAEMDRRNQEGNANAAETAQAVAQPAQQPEVPAAAAVDQGEQNAGQPNAVLGIPESASLPPVETVDGAAGGQGVQGQAPAAQVAQQNPEASRPTPVAESQAPAPSEPGDGGVAPTQDKPAPAITQNKEGAIYVRGYSKEQMAAARDALGIKSAIISEKNGVFPVGTPLAALKEALNPGAAYLPSKDEVAKMKDQLREFIEDNKFNLRKAYNHVQKHGIQRFHDKADAQAYAEKLAKGEGGSWTVKRVNAKNGVMGYWHAEREGRAFSPVEQKILKAAETRQAKDEAELTEQEDMAYDEVLTKAYAALDDAEVESVFDAMAAQYGNASARDYQKAVREYLERAINEKLQGAAEGPAGVSDQVGSEKVGAGRDEEAGRQPESAEEIATPAEAEPPPNEKPETNTKTPDEPKTIAEASLGDLLRAAADKADGVAQPKAEQSAEQKIRSAFEALPSITMDKLYPITVEHNGVKREFIAYQQSIGRGNNKSVIHLATIKRGKMIASDESGAVVNTFTLDGKDRLTETGMPRYATEEDLRQWTDAGFKNPMDGKVASEGKPEFSPLETELAAKAHDTELDGDVGVVVGGGKVKFVSLGDAATAAKKAIDSGTKAVPFQIHNATGIRIGDVDRVLMQVSKVGASDTATAEESLAVEPANRIADFGEKIGGARKDVWSGYKDRMKDAESVDIKAEPLSKSWPAPDYQALIDAGADSWGVAFARAARDEIPRKPSASWKLKSWVANVALLRGITTKLMNGEISTDKAQMMLAEASKTSHGLADIAGRIELYMLVGHRQSLDGVSISVGQYGVHNGIHYDKPKTIWSVSKKAAASAWSNWPRELAIGDTRKEAMDNFKAAYDKLDITPAPTKAATFDIYIKFGESKYLIGKKVGRNHVDLAGPFDTVKEARAYRTEHEADLAEKLEKFKEIPKLRRDVNQPRVGEDMRGGADVTQSLFAETFGFKGVEFGNWVEQARRQKDLNDAFDALMDMAAVLGVPPKALSLNGELGLAFGARGTGGIDAAAAHYESNRIVINLTKKSGEGSLGHEFFHALDNYFSRKRGKAGDFTTEALDVSLAGRNSPYHSDGLIRKEMIEAFGAVMRAIRSTALKARSSKLDSKRSKEYWTTDREMAARAFESYLISKLHDNNASNDYLSNIVDEATWKAAEAMGFELDESYPYPTAGEVPVIRAAFDEFFTAIQTKETDKGVALESRAAATITNETPATIRAGLSRSLGKATVDRLEQSGLLRILDTADSLPDGLTISSTGTALYDGKTAYLIADRMKPAAAIREVLHEIGEHHGLEGMLGEQGYKTLTNRVRFMEKAGDKRVRQAFAFVRDAYPELREDSPVFMKEVLANIGQEADVRAKPWWQEMIAAVRRFLVKLGYGGMIRTSDIEDMVLHSLKMAAQENHIEHSRGMVPAMASKVGAGTPAFKAVDTESAEFKAWFGDSKVVDADSKPLRVYHGAGRDITSFDISGKRRSQANPDAQGFYFTEDKGVASGYASGPTKAKGDNAAVYPVYLSLQNPEIRTGARHLSFAHTYISPSERASLEAQGYDGVIYIAPDSRDSFLNEYIAFRPEQIKSATSNTGDFDPANPSILESRQAALPNTGATPPAPPTRQTPMNLQGGAPGNRASWNGYEPSKLDDVIRTLQDKQIDSKRTVQAIKDAGRQVADKWDVYLQETLFHGRAAKRTLEFVETELNPLAMELKARGLSMAQLEEFLHARHAEEANALIADRNPDMPDGGSGMTNQQAQDYFSGLDPAVRRKLEAVAKRVDAIIANTRKLYVSYGLESQETVDGWGDTFKHYVPLMREDKDGGMGIGQGFSIKGKETKSRTGSTRTVVDILANIAMQRERAIVRGEKNRVATALMGLAKLNPNPDFWTFDKVPHEQVFNPKTGLVEDRPDPMFKTRDNVIVAKIADGRGGVQERAVVFAEDNEQAMHMARALKNLDAAQLEGLIGATAKLTRYFASVNTQYNPIFGVTNLVRDVQDAMLNLTSTPIAGHKADVLKHTLGALRGIYIDTRQMRKGQPATSAYAQLWEEFQHEGGQTGYRDMFRTSADRAHAIEKMIDPHGWTDSPLGKVFTAGGLLKVPLTKAQDIAGPLFDWLSDYNEAMENAVRLAAYKVGKEQGMSNQQAAAMAKGLTVNFNRKGQIGIQAGAIYAFFNASMQGTGRIAETLFTIQGNDAKTIRLSGAGQKIVAGGILLGSMQALMLAAMGFGDDEPPEFVRERNTIIPIGDKKYITIPMPLGFAILPNIGRVSTEFVLGGFKSPAKHVARLMGIMADAFNPVGGNGTILQIISPTALDPAVALAENKDWTKKPIAKVSFDKTTPGHKLWKDTASTPSKWIAEAINTMSGGTKHVAGAVSPTPDQIDYLFGLVTGGVGREAVKIEQTVMSTATGEDLPPHKIPLVGRFYGDAEAQSSQASTFYSNINRINEYEAEIKGRRKEGRGSEVSAFIAENPEARLVLRANHIERQVQKLRKEKHDLIEKGATRGRVKIIETRIKAEMEKFNRAVEASKQRQKEAA